MSETVARSSAARTISSALAQRRYTVGRLTPALRATSATVTPPDPRTAMSSTAASSMRISASSQTGRSSRSA